MALDGAPEDAILSKASPDAADTVSKPEAMGFLATVYTDWRDKTGTSYFAILFLSALAVTNWEPLLIFFSDMNVEKKIELIKDVNGNWNSYLGPLAFAFAAAMGFAVLHLILAGAISGIERLRKTYLAQQNAALRYAQKSADEKAKEDYEKRKLQATKAENEKQQAAIERTNLQIALEAATDKLDEERTKRSALHLLSQIAERHPQTVTRNTDRTPPTLTFGNGEEHPYEPSALSYLIRQKNLKHLSDDTFTLTSEGGDEWAVNKIVDTLNEGEDA